jgi:hypothetical protein
MIAGVMATQSASRDTRGTVGQIKGLVVGFMAVGWVTSTATEDAATAVAAMTTHHSGSHHGSGRYTVRRLDLLAIEIPTHAPITPIATNVALTIRGVPGARTPYVPIAKAMRLPRRDALATLRLMVDT